MKTQDLRDWLEIIGIFSVVLSLIFVGLQMRQEHEISPEEYDSLFRMVASVLYLYDNAHFQYQEGFVSEEFWATTRTSIKVFIAPPTINTIVMDRLIVQGRPEFDSVVRTIDEELRAEATSP